MLNTLAFMYSVRFCYQIIINKWNMPIIVCKTNTQCMSCSTFHPRVYKSVQRSNLEMWVWWHFSTFNSTFLTEETAAIFLKLPLGELTFLELWDIPVRERLKSYMNLGIRLRCGVPTDLRVFLVVTNACTFNHTPASLTGIIKCWQMDLLCPMLKKLVVA